MSTVFKPHSGSMHMPALLDRLSDPDKTKNKHTRHMSRNTYRQAVLRDLQWLLNCPNLYSQLALGEFPEVSKSVLNYGIPSYAGANFTDADLSRVSQAIKRAILYFEPRIIKDSLFVHTVREPESALAYNKALFRIEASLWFEPYPIDMTIRAQWDSEIGSMHLQDAG